MTAASQLSQYTTPDGAALAVRDWPLEAGVRARGVVLIVHGLGEHSGRYQGVAERLHAWGFAVRAYDHWGHGQSSGAPGSLPNDERLLEDLAAIIDSSRARVPSGTPLIVLGHSMGGLVASRFVSLGLRPVDGLVLSSPALDAGMNAFQKLLVAVLPKVVPNLRVGNGLDPAFLSHDSTVVRAYQQDPLVHDRISARLARFFATQGWPTIATAARWQVPTLLMYAGADRLVNPQGSRRFAEQAPPDVVRAVCFESLFHEIFNETESEPVFATLRDWLDQHF
jgi:alpha-beta hydrolase superfamily lysophospholipase